MRVWVDLTNSPHVLVMRPLIAAMREDGHEVRVTTRDFAQTVELCDRFGIEHTTIGRHRGGRVASKAAGLATRSAALARWARPGGFDVALGHGSNDVAVAARLLGIPSATAFDYEWASVQHHVNCRLARAVVAQEAPGGGQGPNGRTGAGRAPGEAKGTGEGRRRAGAGVRTAGRRLRPARSFQSARGRHGARRMQLRRPASRMAWPGVKAVPPLDQVGQQT